MERFENRTREEAKQPREKLKDISPRSTMLPASDGIHVEDFEASLLAD